MSPYKINFTGTAQKNLRKIAAKDVMRILEKVEDLAAGREPLDIKKLNGMKELYRMRCGDYRIVFKKNEKEIEILVVLICHRSHVYELLKKLQIGRA
jgi:mRNA interferase RelE/StbE